MNAAARVKPSHWRLYSLIGLMTFLWSVNFVVAKAVVREVPPIMTAGIRTAIAGLLMLPIYFWERRNHGPALWTKADLPMLILLGMFGVTLNQVFFVSGIGSTSVAHAGIIIAMSPILVLVIAAAIGQETISITKVVGMLLAVAGVVALQLSPSKGAGTTMAGDALIFLAGFTFALFTVMGKRVAHNFDSITINTFAYAGGGLALLPVVLWQSTRLPLGQISWSAWGCILYMAIFPSVLCYLIYYYALMHIPASRVSAFSYLQPLIATSLAIPFLGESPSASMVTGGALVLTGVFIAERA